MSKTNIKSRLFAVLLALVMVIGYVPVPVMAANYDNNHSEVEDSYIGAGNYEPEIYEPEPSQRSEPEATFPDTDNIIDIFALNAIIEEADNLIESDYTFGSWQLLRASLAAARHIASSPNALQSQIDDAAASLRLAIDSLARPSERAALCEAIKEAENQEQDSYTDNEWAALQIALMSARNVYVDENAAESEIESAIYTLLAAIIVPETGLASIIPASGETITVYISFEGYNLGHGFYIEPVRMTVPTGSNAMIPTHTLLSERGHGFRPGGFLDDITGFNRGFINPPPYITTNLNAAHAVEGGTLSSFMFTPASGWMVSINHILIGLGASSFMLQDGDVIRWQFSVQDFGADLGLSPAQGGWGGELYTHTDKTDLIRALFADGVTSSARQAALGAIINPLAAVSEVETALNRLLTGQEAPVSVASDFILLPAELNAFRGSSHNFVAEVRDQFGNPMPNEIVTLSLISGGANPVIPHQNTTLTSNTLNIAHEQELGTMIVTASHGGQVLNSTVTLPSPNITGTTLNRSVRSGETLNLPLALSPAGATIYGFRVEWASDNESIVTVALPEDSNGTGSPAAAVVTGITAGGPVAVRAYLIDTASNTALTTVTYNVTVTPVPTGLTIVPGNEIRTVAEGAAIAIPVILYPQGAAITGFTVVRSSNDTSIATVAAGTGLSANATGIRVGETIISAQLMQGGTPIGDPVSFATTVNPILSRASAENISITAGGEETLQVQHNVTTPVLGINRFVQWTSSDENIAIVTNINPTNAAMAQSTLVPAVTGVSNGTVTITGQLVTTAARTPLGSPVTFEITVGASENQKPDEYVGGWFIVHSPNGQLRDRLLTLIEDAYSLPPLNLSGVASTDNPLIRDRLGVVQRLKITGTMNSADFRPGAATSAVFGTGLLAQHSDTGLNITNTATQPALLASLAELDLGEIISITNENGVEINTFPVRAFRGLRNLERVRLPADFELSNGIFQFAQSLNTIVFGDGAFTDNVYDFRGLTAFTFGGAFNFEHSGARELIFPEGISSFTNSMFANSHSLHTIHFHDNTAPTFGTNVFNNINPRPVAIVPDNTTGGYELAGFFSHFLRVESRDTVGLNRTALNTIIDEAKALNINNFTDESWTVLTTVLSEAENVLISATVQEQIDTAAANLRIAIDALAVRNSDVTFIDVPAGTTVRVLHKRNIRHFEPFTSIPISKDETLSDANRDVWRAAVPFATAFHIEAFTPGETAMLAQRRNAITQHGTTITLDPTPLNQWVNGRGTAWHDANVLTNLDDTGTINLQSGGVFYLDTFRVWQAMSGNTENYFVEPLYNFEVFGSNINVERVGSPGREQFRITAQSPGVSVIKITYDPIEYVLANGNTLFFDGIADANTLAVVVNVDGGSFDTGITARNDFDTYYFDNTVGYHEFTFTPAPGSSVRVHNPLNLSPWGSGWITYTADTDGSFTVELKNGRNIIEITNNGTVRYHVVRARGVSVTVVNETNPGQAFSVGDTARISILGISDPIEKLAGIYNPGFGSALAARIVYTNDAGASFVSNNAPQYQTLTTTFTLTYTLADISQNVLNGHIMVGSMGSDLGAHRNIPLGGVAANMNASPIGPFPFSALPEIVLPTASTPLPPSWEDVMGDALAYIVSAVPNPDFGTVGGEWAVLALARAGHNVPLGYFEGYIQRVGVMLSGLAGHTSPNHTTAGWVLNPATERREVRLNDAQSTENARLIVALTALGIDASNFVHNGAAYDLVARLGNRHDAASNYMWGERQGVNGLIWNLIALNSPDWSSPYEISDRAWVGGTTASRPITLDERIEWILNARNLSGGWALIGNNADADITAMAIQALAPYYGLRNDVTAAVDGALAELRRIQLPNGGWASWGVENVQGSAQVIVALTSLGIDPTGSEWTTAADSNPLTALLSFYDEQTGGFIHGGGVDLMATEQAAYALVSYWRFVEDKAPLYNMVDVLIQTPPVKRASLAAEITRAEGLRSHDFTVPTWTSMQSALTAARNIYANANTTQIQVNTARNNLHGAISALVRVTGVNVANLTNEITRAEGLSSADFTITSWSAMQTMLIAARQTGTNVNSTQIEVDTAANNLRNAINLLIRVADFRTLNSEISLAENLIAGNFTSASWTQLQTALNAARQVRNSNNATQDEVDTAANNLRDARGRLVSTARASISVTDPGATGSQTGSFFALREFTLEPGETAYSLLRRTGLTIQSSGHSTFAGMYVQSINGWGEFSDGPLSGWMIGINGNPISFSASMATLNDGDIVEWKFTRDLGNDLGWGFGGSGINRSALNIEITQAEALTEANYTNPSWSVLNAALVAARQVNNNTNATQAQINTAASNLRTARSNLVRLSGAVINRNALNIEITRAEGLREADYTSPSWSAMQTALLSSRQVLGNTNATQEQINVAADNLRTAINALVRADGIRAINRNTLNAEITRVQGLEQSNYTVASWTTMQAALTAAIAVRDNANATQAQINTAADRLRAAIEALETSVAATIAPVIAADGAAVVSAELEIIHNLIEQAINTGAADITITVPSAVNISRVEVELVSEAIRNIESNELSLTIQSDIGTIALDIETLRGIADGEDDNTAVRVLIEQINDISSLTESQQEAVGNNFTIRLTITAGNSQIYYFGGTVSVIIPYNPRSARENHDLLTVYHVDEFGNISEIAGASYSGSLMSFNTAHFSVFFVSEWISPFIDAVRDDWHFRSVRFVYSNDLMSGTGAGEFSPNINMTRAMIVTILWRLEGAPSALSGGVFSDVSAGSWYYYAVTWASENAIVNGLGNGIFAPGNTATREQLAVILQNYARFKGINISADSFISEFADADAVSSWALGAMQWANSSGIINGRTISTLAPGGTATRAETAAMLRQFVEYVM
ncbi:MAG: S-layer homology domain-containing protein [Defluviitaleaceae bacterium]|nr:S-layer homology domain-containing protein [Defluviitaleaceae bacterium]